VFFSGFFVHALFFPTLLTSNLMLFTKRTIDKKQIPQVPVADVTNKALTVVLYEEGEFDPQVAVVGKSYYLGIINNSDKELMNLTSENPLFRTPRSYGKSEQLMVQLYNIGEYTVSSTLHPDKTLKIIVK
jgi:hypothetical protein